MKSPNLVNSIRHHQMFNEISEVLQNQKKNQNVYKISTTIVKKTEIKRSFRDYLKFHISITIGEK